MKYYLKKKICVHKFSWSIKELKNISVQIMKNGINM